MQWVSVADSSEIDSGDLSQAEQCWTTRAVIHGTSGAGWRWGGCMWCVPMSSVCAGFWLEAVSPLSPGLPNGTQCTWGPINVSGRVKSPFFCSLFSLLNFDHSLLPFPVLPYLAFQTKQKHQDQQGEKSSLFLILIRAIRTLS